MRMIDEEHLVHPAKGVIGMTDYLLENEIKVGLRRVRRLMRLMGIEAVYRRNCTKVQHFPRTPKSIGRF